MISLSMRQRKRNNFSKYILGLNAADILISAVFALGKIITKYEIGRCIQSNRLFRNSGIFYVIISDR